MTSAATQDGPSRDELLGAVLGAGVQSDRSHKPEPKRSLIDEGEDIAQDAKARKEYDRKHGLKQGREGTSGGAFKRSLAETAVDTALAPVTLPARALRAVGVDNAAAELSGEQLLESVAHLRDGTTPAQVRRDREAARAQHPTATAAGEFAGEAVASALPGGVLAAGERAAARAALARTNPEAFAALRAREQRGAVSFDDIRTRRDLHLDRARIARKLGPKQSKKTVELTPSQAKKLGELHARRANALEHEDFEEVIDPQTRLTDESRYEYAGGQQGEASRIAVANRRARETEHRKQLAEYVRNSNTPDHMLREVAEKDVQLLELTGHLGPEDVERWRRAQGAGD